MEQKGKILFKSQKKHYNLNWGQWNWKIKNDKTEITSKGKKFLIEAYDAAEAICKAKNIDNILNDNEKVALAVAKKTNEDKEKALKLAVSTAGTFIGAILAEMMP